MRLFKLHLSVGEYCGLLLCWQPPNSLAFSGTGLGDRGRTWRDKCVVELPFYNPRVILKWFSIVKISMPLEFLVTFFVVLLPWKHYGEINNNAFLN